MSFETTALLVTWAALALLALVVAGLVRQLHHLVQGAATPGTGPAAGAPAPGLELLAPEPGRTTLLLFLGDDCPACRDIFEETLRLAEAPPTRALFSGRALAGEPPERVRVLSDQDDLFTLYEVPATPFAVLVGPDGRIRAAEPVGSVRTLHALVRQAGGRAQDAPAYGTGTPGTAPSASGASGAVSAPGADGDVTAGSRPAGRRN